MSSEDPEEEGNVRRLNVRLLSDLAPAKAYLDRIGARAKNPWSAHVVTENRGYEFDRALIKLRRNREGIFDRITVHPRNPALEPTPEELSAILEAAKKVRWPQLGFIGALPKGSTPDDIINAQSEHRFLFQEPGHGGNFSYVQIYHPGETGRGKYSSWIHLDTGEWTFGQPDKLPLYGAEQLSEDTYRVFIHEGPKAAARTKQKITPTGTSRPTHKWVEELSGVHLGWPGGGNRFRYVDWDVLDALPADVEIYVVADNDDVGRFAAKQIAERHLSRFENTKIIEFPASYGEGFDLGDDWPEDPVSLSSMTSRPRYTGDAMALETSIPVEEVAVRLAEQGLAFQVGGKVVIVSEFQSAVERQIGDPTKSAKVLRSTTAEPETLRTMVEQVSRWQAWDERSGEIRDRKLPPWVLQQLVQRPNLLPPLAGVVDHPVLSGGRLLTGDIRYDRESMLYLSSPELDFQWSGGPKEALRFLTEDWLGRFPFATKGDLIRALLIPLTLLLRRTEVRGGSPLFFVTSPGAQTGKSLLARTLFLAVLGRLPAPMAFSSNDEEFKKSFMAALMSSPSGIYYDNMPNGWSVGSRELDAYATADEYIDRILGKSEQVTVPALSTLVFCGNNIEPKDDTRTRTIEVRLLRQDTENEDMKKALSFTAKHRAEILAALRTVACQASVIGSTPSRFPDWEAKVAGPVIGLTGDRDLLKAVAEAQDSTEMNWHSEELEEVLTCIYRLQQSTGDGLVTTTQMLEDERCRIALEALIPRRETNQPLRAPVVGTVLRKHRDRQIGGLRLVLETRRDSRKGRDVHAYRAEGEAPLDTSDMAPM